MDHCFRTLLLSAGTVLVFLGARASAGVLLWAEPSRRVSSAAPLRPRRASLAARAAGDTVAQLTIPRLDSRLYVLEGDDDAGTCAAAPAISPIPRCPAAAATASSPDIATRTSASSRIIRTTMTIDPRANRRAAIPLPRRSASRRRLALRHATALKPTTPRRSHI